MKTKFLIFVLITSLISSCDSYVEKKQKYQSLIDEIAINYNDKNYEDVIDKSNKALKIFDSLALPHIYKSKAYLALDKTKKAIKEANKAIEIEGDKSYGNIILSEIYYIHKEDNDNAIKYAKNYEKFFPDNPEKNLLLAQIYYSDKKYNEAIKYYTLCIDAEYNLSKSLVGRAFSYENQNNVKKSIDDFETLKNITTSDMLSYVNFTLGNFYKKNNEYIKSNTAFFSSDSILSYKYIAQNYVSLNKFDSASIYYANYFKYFPNDLIALNENHEVLKVLNNTSLYKNYLEIKNVEWSSLNWFSKLLYIVIPLLFFGIIFLSITTKYIRSEDKKYDRYSFLEGLPATLFAFLFGGGWLYTKNIFAYCISIVSVIFFSRLSFLIFFNWRSDFLFEILFSDKYLIYTISFIGFCIVLDLLSLSNRINKINISLRKKAAKNQESVNRKKTNQEAMYESHKAYNELIQLENNGR